MADSVQVEAELREILGGCRELLARHTPQARQILSRLLDGRLVFTPREEEDVGYYEFTGKVYWILSSKAHYRPSATNLAT